MDNFSAGPASPVAFSCTTATASVEDPDALRRLGELRGLLMIQDHQANSSQADKIGLRFQHHTKSSVQPSIQSRLRFSHDADCGRVDRVGELLQQSGMCLEALHPLPQASSQTPAFRSRGCVPPPPRSYRTGRAGTPTSARKVPCSVSSCAVMLTSTLALMRAIAILPALGFFASRVDTSYGVRVLSSSCSSVRISYLSSRQDKGRQCPCWRCRRGVQPTLLFFRAAQAAVLARYPSFTRTHHR